MARKRHSSGARWRPGNIPLPEANLTLIGIGLALHRVRPWTRRRRRLLGSALIAAGGWLVVRSLAAAGPVELQRPGRLVTSGPYAVSRNPMYFGWTLLHLGVGLLGRSGWIVAGVPVAAWWTHRQVLREEAGLQEVFGVEYERYRRATPRYLWVLPGEQRDRDSGADQPGGLRPGQPLP